MIQNKGFDSRVIAEFKEKLKSLGKTYPPDEQDESSSEYAHFYFTGLFEGKEVIYDAVMYTLRLQHESEVFEIAEQRAAEHFPEYNKITNDEDTNGNQESLDSMQEQIGLFMAEVIMELEEEESVRVKEHVDLDQNADFGVGLDIGINVEMITQREIEKFIKDFNEDTLHLDEGLYSFQTRNSNQ